MDKKEAEKIYASGKEATVLALLELATEVESLRKQIDELEQSLAARTDHPSTPSGMKPVWEKPSAHKRGRKKPGRKKGHPGSRRAPFPEEAITQTQEHRLKICPQCNNPVSGSCRTRQRLIGDIPDLKPEVTRRVIHGSWCATCKRIVEPIVSDALPRATIGNRALTLSCWLHYGMGVTISHIVELFNVHFHFSLTPGGMVQMWQRLAEILYNWYIDIMDEAWQSAYLHADETGWRVNGVTHWLWCFTNPSLTCYLIHRSRGSPVLADFFGDLFPGILISDFWAAYGRLETAARQVCFAHLFREMEKVAKTNQTPQWLAFRKTLSRFLRDALRLAQNTSLTEQGRNSRIANLHQRLDQILDASPHDPDCLRLIERLRKHREAILTFLDADIPATNNQAEREIRPAVIMRKNSYGNMSERGAEPQAVLMSIYRTLKLRGHDPLETITAALKHYLLHAQLPPLPH